MSHVTPFSKSEEILENGASAENHFEKVPENRTAVDNILRVNHGNQMRLGLMADAKANIMITVASIVFSITIANLDIFCRLFVPLTPKSQDILDSFAATYSNLTHFKITPNPS